MAWMIVRIEPRENDTLPRRERLPVVASLARGGVQKRQPTISEFRSLMEAHGFTINPGGRKPLNEWPLVAYCYLSPNREGVGRMASQLARYAARRIS